MDMKKITNEDLSNELSYIKGKLESEKIFAKEHRSWEVTQIERIHDKLDAQNGRLRKTENTISWFKGSLLMFGTLIGYLFKKTL